MTLQEFSYLFDRYGNVFTSVFTNRFYSIKDSICFLVVSSPDIDSTNEACRFENCNIVQIHSSTFQYPFLNSKI